MPPDRPRQDPFDWLFARQRFGVVPGLDRTRALLAAHGDPHLAFDAVLVGGTNGKGSAVATLAQTLLADGRRVGRFVSPDLGHLTERIEVGGATIAAPELAAILDRLRPASERLEATFFEILFAAACLHFATTAVEVAVVEVGLGGRFDASNVLPALRSVITGVALDHTAVLGDSVEAIAADKAGILRPGRPAFSAAAGPALAVIEAVAAAQGTPLTVFGRDLVLSDEVVGWQGSSFTLHWQGEDHRLHTPLLGRHQLANVALAAAVALSLGVAPASLRRGVAQVWWPGRLERLEWRGRPLLLDGAHNPAAATALARALVDLGPPPLALVLGVSDDKDVESLAAALAPLVSTVVATQAGASARAVPAEVLAERVGAQRWERLPERALAVAAAAEPAATLLVAGSLFLVGEVRSLALGTPADRRQRWQ